MLGGPDAIIGPILPPGLLTSRVSDLTSSDQQSSSTTPTQPLYGPVLPPSSVSVNLPVIGPVVPSWFNNASKDSPSSDDEDYIGPMPVSDADRLYGDDLNDAQRDIERRAKRMKERLTNTGNCEELKREEWMTVLPPELSKNFGLGPRSFHRRTPGPTGDRSVWTDTPSDTIEKQKTGQSAAAVVETDAELLKRSAQLKYDEEMGKRSEEFNKVKRADSLMVVHKKNLKRKNNTKQDTISAERRPFDRDVDLKVNAMDDARRKALIKQSRQLNDKFSSGHSQFL